jgi:methylated-DNA-[protein]-cysteine S-methyltransferase
MSRPPLPPSALARGTLEVPGKVTLQLAWSARGLVRLDFHPSPGLTLLPEAPVPAPYAELLTRYFAGEPVEPTALPVDLHGTPFQLRVWNALRAIPRGQVRTYGELAVAIGSPGGMRAVGGANGRNPVAVVVPCHRVVAAGGQLGGFTSGLAFKRLLLGLEGLTLQG